MSGDQAAESVVTLGLQIPSKKVLWSVFRGLNTFLEGIWSPRVSCFSFFFEQKNLSKKSTSRSYLYLVRWCLLSPGWFMGFF